MEGCRGGDAVASPIGRLRTHRLTADWVVPTTADRDATWSVSITAVDLATFRDSTYDVLLLVHYSLS